MAYIKLAMALSFMAGLMVFPKECAEAARHAMAAWANSVAPVLFPFAAVLPFLTCHEAQSIYGMLFGKIVEKLFKLPGRTAPAIVVGLIAGSPAGALAAARIAGENQLTKGQLTRLSGIVCGVSPIYALSVMGSWGLVIAQAASQLITGVLFRNTYNRNNTSVDLNISASSDTPVQTAVLAVLRVCGYMVLFSVSISLLATLTGSWIWDYAVFVDLPGGIYTCPAQLRPLALGFGGLCIGFQNLGAMKDMVKPSAYFAQKSCGALICWVLYEAIGRSNREEIVAAGSEFELQLLILAGIMLPIIYIFWRKTLFLTIEKMDK